MLKGPFLCVRITTIHKPFNTVSLTDAYQVILYRYKTATTCFRFVDTTCYERRYFECKHFNKDPDFFKNICKVVYFHDFFLVSIITTTHTLKITLISTITKKCQEKTNLQHRTIFTPTPSGTQPKSFICFIAVRIYCSNRPLNIQSMTLSQLVSTLVAGSLTHLSLGELHEYLAYMF